MTSPVSAEALAPLPADCEGVQFSEPLSDDDYRHLAELLERQPEKRLLAMQLESTRHTPITDLTFLRFFPNARSFTSSLELLESLEGVQHLLHAADVRIFKAAHRMSAAPLAALTDLTVLWLDGHYSDRGALRELVGLTNFKMGYAAKLADLSFLPPNLTRFSMNLGSVTDITALADLPHLQQLLFHKVQGIADLSPLADATGLRTLYLASLTKVTDLFDMSALADLTELTVSAMPNLTDLRPVLSAPNLAKLSVSDVPSLNPSSWHDTCVGWLAQGKPPFWE